MSLLDDLAKHGRNGDTLVAHINPEEAQLLKDRGGAGTTNPATGLLEFYGYGMSGVDSGAGEGYGGSNLNYDYTSQLHTPT